MLRTVKLVSDVGGDPSWQEREVDRPLPFWRSLQSDAFCHVALNRVPASASSRMLFCFRVLCTSAGLRMMLVYRLGHTARGCLGLLGKMMAAFLFWLNRHWHTCSIASTARLHGGLILPHPQNIVIGSGVVVGPGTWIFQNVTLGGQPRKLGMPRIGAGACIFAGAVICGPITVGDNVTVGANVVITRDIPNNSTVLLPEMKILSSPI
jgi:serine O-acetyltransferase